MFAVLALASGLVLAAVWGLAAGSSSLELALADLYKVPMVSVLSGARDRLRRVSPVSLAGHGAHYLTVVWATACALGVVAILVMAVLFRRASKAAEAEEVDRILAEHASEAESNRRASHVSSRHGADD